MVPAFGLNRLAAFAVFPRRKEEAGSTKDPDVLLELGGKHGRLGCRAVGNRKLRYGCADLIEEGFANSRYAPANDDHFRIKQSQHATEPGAQVEACFVDDEFGHAVAAARRLVNHFRVDPAQVSVAQLTQQARRGVLLFQPNARAPGHGRTCCQRFNASPGATATKVRASSVKRDVASFAGDAVFSLIDLFIDDNACSYPRADRNVEDVGVSAGRAE